MPDKLFWPTSMLAGGKTVRAGDLANGCHIFTMRAHDLMGLTPGLEMTSATPRTAEIRQGPAQRWWTPPAEYATLRSVVP